MRGGYSPIIYGPGGLAKFLVPVGKTQTKYLTADVTTDTTMSDLTFSNLIVGQWYSISLNGAFVVPSTGADNIQIKILNSSQIGLMQSASQFSGGSAVQNLNHYVEFLAASTSVTFDSSSVSVGSSIIGNSSITETFVTLSEIPAKQVTTDW